MLYVQRVVMLLDPMIVKRGFCLRLATIELL